MIGLLWLAAGPLACGEASVDSARCEAPCALTRPDAWARLGASDEPFPEERPAEERCPEWGVVVEDQAVEVRTDICAYASLGQALEVPLFAGDTISGGAWHGQLWAEEPTQAHVALGVGGELLFEVRPEVPGGAEVYAIERALREDHPAGALIWLHVHNHGSNAYSFAPVVRVGP